MIPCTDGQFGRLVRWPGASMYLITTFVFIPEIPRYKCGFHTAEVSMTEISKSL